jgi:DNA-binding PadR family transcriptional regulator
MSAWKAKSQHLILLALRDGPKHGYDVLRHLEQRGGGRVTMGFGSLYPALHALEKAGLVHGTWEAVGERKDKKTYELTRKGRAELAAITADYREFVAVMSGLLAEG